ncbi:MAG TPA: histidine kinase [Dehalococcoidales bacterium]|nr:histidine kinase [Spirochaetota bacterium]HUV56680.1 histidine kinase [Dehalococcoidales bacterium]
MHLTKTLAVALETVGCVIILTGIAIEVSMGADLGYVLITAGAFFVAVGGMVFAKLLRK